MRPRQIFVVIAVGIAAAALAACATLSVGSYVERTASFTSYGTYAWGEPDALPTGDPRLDNNPFFKDYVEGAIDKQFALRGLTLVDANEADLLVHYHINVAERLDVNRIDRDYQYCQSSDCEPRVDVVEAGTLVIDVHDGTAKTLVWRGWARDFVAAALFNQDVMERQFTDQVQKMMGTFPVPMVRSEVQPPRTQAPFWTSRR